MKTLLALAFVLSTATVAAAQGNPTPCNSPCSVQPAPQAPATAQPAAPQPAPAPATVAYAEPAAQPQPALQPAAQPAQSATATDEDDDSGWHTPVGHRFMHGFRLGYMHIAHYEDKEMDRDGKSIKEQFGLKSPDMFVLGYEGFYRIVGHSWLNVLMVGNVTVAGLEQSKFIPAASGLIGFEFNRSFEAGVGVNLTPDPVAPSHMIVAGGWTPRAGSIMVPFHVFFIPDTDNNWRGGATIGMNW